MIAVTVAFVIFPHELLARRFDGEVVEGSDLRVGRGYGLPLIRENGTYSSEEWSAHLLSREVLLDTFGFGECEANNFIMRGIRTFAVCEYAGFDCFALHDCEVLHVNVNGVEEMEDLGETLERSMFGKMELVEEKLRTASKTAQ